MASALGWMSPPVGDGWGSGFRYSVLSHQSCHGVSHRTAREDLRKLAGRSLLSPSKEGRRDIFRVPEELAERLPV